jgi:hypothetical protein
MKELPCIITVQHRAQAPELRYRLLIRPSFKQEVKEQTSEYILVQNKVEESKRYVGGCNRETVSNVSERK